MQLSETDPEKARKMEVSWKGNDVRIAVRWGGGGGGGQKGGICIIESFPP